MKNNIVLIWQPHFNTLCFRVNKKKQTSMKKNYIVVCCSPSYNGIYSWDGYKRKYYDTWVNNRVECWCVPIEHCKFEGDLSIIKNKDMIKQVIAEQEKWFKKYDKKRRPSWFLGEANEEESNS